MSDGLPWGMLLLWGAVVGVDLVSVLQGLLSRPLVAATGAGLLIGDPAAGLAVGVGLELFALDVLPIGASQYPEFGPAAVAAVAAVAGLPLSQGLGIGVMFGLGLGVLAGRSIHLLRRLNGAAARLATPALSRGDPRAVARVQFLGLSADLARAVTVTAAALAFAWVLRSSAVVPGPLARNLGLIAIAGGLVAAVNGAMQRAAGRAWRLGAVGLTLGAVVAWLIG